MTALWHTGVTQISATQSAPAIKTVQGSYSGIWLSPEPKKYLERLGPITVCPDPDWLPFAKMDSNGNFTGIAADVFTFTLKD